MSLHFNIVNVWISYKCKSQGVVAPTYEASERPKEYTLASPTCSPCANVLLVPTLWFLNWTTFVLFPPRLIVGAPRTLFTLIRLPILNGIDAFFIVFVVLGFSTSMTVVPGKDTSYPLTYAVPGDNFTHIKSSLGTFPSSVAWFSTYNPPDPTSSFNAFWVVTRNGSTA